MRLFPLIQLFPLLPELARALWTCDHPLSILQAPDFPFQLLHRAGGTGAAGTSLGGCCLDVATTATALSAATAIAATTAVTATAATTAAATAAVALTRLTLTLLALTRLMLTRLTLTRLTLTLLLCRLAQSPLLLFFLFPLYFLSVSRAARSRAGPRVESL